MFFNLSSPDNTNEGVVEGVDYVLIAADNRGTTHKLRVFNFDNPKLCPREGIIEIVPMKHSKRHENYQSFGFCHDPITDIYIGIPAGYDDKTGKLKFRRLTIREDETLDRTKEQEAMRAAVILNSYYVEGSPLVKGKPKYKVYDKEKVAEEYEKERSLKRRAITIADGLVGDKLVAMGIDLGLQVDQMSPRVLFMEIGKIAEGREWHKIIEVVNNPQREILTIVNRGLKTGILTQEPGLGICYGKIALGINKQIAIEALRGNDSLRQTIEQLSLKQEKDSVKAMMSTKSKEPEAKDDNANLLAMMKQQMDDQTKIIQELREQQLTAAAEKESEALAATDPEFAEMRKEAKALKTIQGWALCGKETLRKKLEEARNQQKN